MTYTQEQQELLDKAAALQQEKGISQNEVSKLIGISNTALSQLKSGKYPADPKKLFDTMAKYFGVKEKAKLTYTEVPYAETSFSSQIYDLISICQVTGGLTTAVGDAGIDVLREDIMKLFPLLTETHMEQEIDFLHTVAQTPQSVRGAVGLFSSAYNNGNYSYEGLVAMAKFAEMEVVR